MGTFVPRFVRQLRDVLLTAPADGEVLTYDSADEKWKNEAGGGGGGATTLAALTDVSGGPPATGEAPVWDGDSFELTNVATQAELDALAGTVATDAELAAAISALAAASVLDGDAAGGVLSGTYPNPGFAVDMATQAELDAAVAAEASARTTADGLLVPKSLYDANTVLAAVADDTPAALTMGASTILARLAAGNIKAATPAELRTLLALVVGTDVQAALDQTDGQAGVVVPTIAGWVPINFAFTTPRLYCSRFVLLKDRTVTSIKFRSNTVGTGNVDVCIFNAAGAVLGSSGSVSGKKGANTWQTVNLSSPLALTAGTIYYVGLVTDTSDGSYNAVFWNASTGLGYDQMWGSTLGLLQSFYYTLPAFPIGTPTVAVTAASGSIGPLVGLV